MKTLKNLWFGCQELWWNNFLVVILAFIFPMVMWPIREKYMTAGTSYFPNGKFFSQKPDLCVVWGIKGDEYIGQYVYGTGFINIRFLRETTRNLNKAERKEHNGRKLCLSGVIIGKICF